MEIVQDRRKSIKVWVSDMERNLLEEKAKKYGYKTIAKYVRDAVIYEKVTIVDISNRKEIYELYSNNTKEINKIGNSLWKFIKYTNYNNINYKELHSTILLIAKKQKQILQLIEDKLEINLTSKINNENVEEEDANN